MVWEDALPQGRFSYLSSERNSTFTCKIEGKHDVVKGSDSYKEDKCTYLRDQGAQLD